MNDKTDDLEMKLAFQEDLLSKLDHAVASQQQQILALEKKIALLTQQMRAIDQGQADVEEEPPPHY